jgi:hypothetical protein
MSRKRRLEDLEAKVGDKRVSWTLENGRRVSFPVTDMFNAYMEHAYREGDALAGEPLRPLGEVNQALLQTSEEERARLAERHGWIANFQHQLDRQENPDPEDQRFFQGIGS